MSRQAAFSSVIWSAMVRVVNPGSCLANSTVFMMHLVESSLNLSHKSTSNATRRSELLLYTPRETKFSYGKCLITASIKAERVAHELWLSALVKSACKQKQNQRTVLGVIDKQAHICNYSIDSSFSVSSLIKNQYRAKTARLYPHRWRFYWVVKKSKCHITSNPMISIGLVIWLKYVNIYQSAFWWYLLHLFLLILIFVTII